ncbi:DUF1622 domain-containing protein [Spirulina subsalsa FACHB-351]|uniref:DUF1622 domain-containing protein n=1 Tax=Spirulina subsalsa FACHB-351 TaxID=234711 RepID=A0ABT3LBY2_9CYAN|nr:DUF1622 domain-containing protein [Spirulina subsalsa FACHB-351]
MSIALTVRMLNSTVVSICQLLALLVISVGIIKALTIYLRRALFTWESGQAFQEGRLELGYSFSLGLSFLVGGSILKTTIAPTWNEIGQLAAIIALRTVLNHLLLKAIANHTQTPNPEPPWQGLLTPITPQKPPHESTSSP